MHLPKPLLEALETYKSLELVQKHMDELVERLNESYAKKAELEDLLIKEYEDVEELEKKNIKGLFVAILGDKIKQLEIERQEYLHAFLELKEHNNGIKLLEKQQKILTEKLESAGKIKQKFEDELNNYEISIKKENPAMAQELSQISTQVIRAYNFKREIHEALIMASKSKRVLGMMCEELSKAKNWGDWKTYYSEIQLQKLKQKGAIDKAQQLGYEAKELLLQFESELKDVLKHKKLPVNYNLDALHHFMNIYFENLISDWVVREKVRNSLHSIESLKDNVQRIHHSLELELNQSDEQLNYLNEKRQNLLLGTA